MENEIYMFLGFLFSLYSVIANDSIQTLGTFINSNSNKYKWYYLATFISLILVAVLTYSYIVNLGDVTYGRLLDKGIPFPETFNIFHVLAPLCLFILTRFGIPVSTTFLILSVFGTGFFIEKVIIKSIIGYFIAAISGYFIWYFISDYIEKTTKNINEKKWTILQWLATGYLWGVWLSHDLANIAVYLPRKLPLDYFLGFIFFSVIGIYYIFYKKGGAIQNIIKEKTNTTYIKSATIIDFVYATILFIFKEVSNIPMSTTWVFIGLLAGRELAITYALNKHKIKTVYPLIFKDMFKVFFGLAISLLLAYGVKILS
jgi:phosphate/sulfate permease